MSAQQHTPESDAAAYYVGDFGYSVEVVKANFARNLESQRDELAAALRVFVAKYRAAPDGDLGCGLVNGDFFRAEAALAKLKS